MNIIKRMASVNLNNVEDADEEVGRNDHVVGVMSEPLKRIRGLSLEVRDRVIKLQVKISSQMSAHSDAHKNGTVNSDCCTLHNSELQQFDGQLRTLIAEIEAAKETFFGAAKLEFPELLGKEDIRVRKGFTMVWTEAEKEQPEGCESEPSLPTGVMQSIKTAAARVFGEGVKVRVVRR